MSKRNINFSKSTRYRNRKRASIMLSEALVSEDDNEFQYHSNSSSINTDTVVLSLPNYSTTTDVVDQTNLNCSNSHVSHNTSLEHLSEESNEASESISCSSISSDSNDNPDLKLTISMWAITHNITHVALTDLLKRLSKFPEFKELPKNSRTLLKTPLKTNVKEVGGGIYHHFGIEEELKDLIIYNKNIPAVLWLYVGIDGLPVTTNPPSQLWPILGYFANLPTKKPNIFIIGAYHGKTKPLDCNTFLFDFVRELKVLIIDGFFFDNKKIHVEIRALICDAPAKSFVLNTKGHTGKVSCVRCQNVGKWVTDRVCFTEVGSPSRTHNDFMNYKDPIFHNGKTILTELPNFDLVKSIPFDYMHCVCIGVMKKLLLFWIGAPKHKQNMSLPATLINALDIKLNQLSVYIPIEFQRRFSENSRKHPLHDASRWKATELRQCLLYLGFIIFRNFLNDEVYDHFLELFVAIRILSTQSSTEDVKHFGSLNCYSAFPFESFMQPLKKKIKTGVRPLQQLARRYAEKRAYSSYMLTNQSKESCYGPIKLQNVNQNRPMLPDVCEPQYTGWKNESFSLKLDKANSCIKLISGAYVLVENIATSSKDNSTICIIGRQFEKLSSFFNKPCDSQLLKIYEASNTSHLKSWAFDDIKEKVIHIPLDDRKSCIIPFLH
ncbi:uncharacterized protein LOC111026297 [Myzus persicae]|uniref:uncharacterized protein LOC111026297 n=1 Tax=Myzus persicae TaxID=13164 RepID=UPI000B93608F|nr:uncharacterized protein LOC111026297 [Myzus persicae]